MVTESVLLHFLPPPSLPPSLPPSPTGTIQPPHTAESSNDVEVDNLLQWTRNLDEHELNT